MQMIKLSAFTDKFTFISHKVHFTAIDVPGRAKVSGDLLVRLSTRSRDRGSEILLNLALEILAVAEILFAIGGNLVREAVDGRERSPDVDAYNSR